MNSEVTRLKGWTRGSVAIGALLLSFSSLSFMWDIQPTLTFLLSVVMAITAIVTAIVSLVVLWRIPALPGVKAVIPAVICLISVIAEFTLPWRYLADHIAWPVREPGFQSLSADFRDIPGLTKFCYWDSEHYRLNDVFKGGLRPDFHGYSPSGKIISLDEDVFLLRAGVTREQVHGLGRRMRRLGVSCMWKAQAGDTEFTTWGTLNYQCGYVHIVPDSRWAAMQKNVKFRHINKEWLDFCM